MLAVLAPAATADTAITSCTATSQAPQPLTVTVSGQAATGVYSLPSAAPKGVVVVGHGFPGTAAGEASLVQQIATNDGVIALAMNYRGTDLSTGLGWRVIEGAQDSIAATNLFETACDTAQAFVNSVFGISMGGNMSGIAVSSNATRPSGKPLFDYWFDVAGVTDVPELYGDAQAISLLPLGGISTIGTDALTAMQAEFGGTPLTAPGAYLGNSPFLRAPRMKSSGLKGVVISHGVLDGEVTSDNSDLMYAALIAAGIPVDYYTTLFRAPATPPGLTLDGDVLGLIPGYVSPFAGHVNAVVGGSATTQLSALYNQGVAPSGIQLTLNDGQLGSYPLLSLPTL
jgi:hypothetical protein